MSPSANRRVAGSLIQEIDPGIDGAIADGDILDYPD